MKLKYYLIILCISISATAFSQNVKYLVKLTEKPFRFEVLKEGDKIVAIAQQDALKNKFGFYTIDIKKEEKTVALFKGTVYRSDKLWEL